MRDRFDDDDTTVTPTKPATSVRDSLAIYVIGIALIAGITACYGAWTGAIGPVGNFFLLCVAAILLFWITPAIFRRP